MAVNILRDADILDITDTQEIEYFLEILNDRKDSIEWMEPMSSGETYDKWSDRLDSIEDICDQCERLKDEEDLKERKALLDKLKLDLQMHQIEYGGLKRFR